ncbi:MAG TPA: SUMF1/EgtB/PvdO family nonheme iron enzyme [Polyangiaceae bacterium]|nr:SUMF1/EgtB/PvdO family nonheme iron enzyme [Polyangiaceae bacterium]
MIRKALAAMLAALLAQFTFGEALSQIASANRRDLRLPRVGFEADGLTPTTAVAEAMQRVAPVTSAPTPSAAVVSDHPPAGTPLPVPAPTEVSKACPSDMVLVEGEYCTNVFQSCARWLDDEKLPFARCNEFRNPSRCIGTRVKQRYCIDRYEYTVPGEELPLNFQSFQKSSALCERLGKRLCTETEWTFACEGEEMRPYPYGFTRAPKCNQDRGDLFEVNPHRQILADRRERADARPECVSPFGVYNLAGNMDESVLREGKAHIDPFRNALKGGWWMAARNRCRPATTAHDDYYKDIQVGTRCCAAASPD